MQALETLRKLALSRVEPSHDIKQDVIETQRTAPESPFTRLFNKSGAKHRGDTYATHKLLDSLYGCVTLSKLSVCIMGHPVFQRLQHIKQLGTMSFCKKYKTAVHTRYEHCRGVAWLAHIAASTAQQQIHTITNKEVLLVEVAGLCHDLGHGPYSHSFDQILTRAKHFGPASRHEYRSQVLVRYVLEQLMLSKTTDVKLTDSDIRLVQYFIDPKSYCEHFATELDERGIPQCVTRFHAGLQHIVNSDVTVDVDKMDYLFRDAIMLGISTHLNNEIYTEKLLRGCKIIDGSWAFSIYDFGDIYDMVCRRYLLYSNAYTCDDAIIYCSMITDAIGKADSLLNFGKHVALQTAEDVEMFCSLTDDYILERIINAPAGCLNESKQLIERVLTNTNLYEKIGTTHTKSTEFDETIFTQTNPNVLDKSSPLNLIPKVMLHCDEKLIFASDLTGIQSLIRRSDARR